MIYVSDMISDWVTIIQQKKTDHNYQVYIKKKINGHHFSFY